MGEFTVREWKRHGKDRLYVNIVGTAQSIGYYDRQTGQLHVDDPTLRYPALEALAPFLGGEISAFAHAMESAPPPPDRDLTGNKAGAAVASRAEELSPGRFQRVAAKLLGLRTEATSWEAGAAGERQVGKRLDLLKERGWNVLHSVDLRSGADIDHIVIGPGGVFTVNTKHHAGARIRTKGDFVRVNGHQHPYVRNSRNEASAAARRLTRACGIPVDVTGVVAFVGAGSLTVQDGPDDVRLAPGERLETLFLGVPSTLDAGTQAKIFAVARRREVWLS
jgi:hypothetical protein